MRRAAPWLPLLAALSVWALGSGSVLFHVLRADDFVMSEIRRNGLVGTIAGAFVAFLPVYVALGLVAAYVVEGIARLRRAPRPAGIGRGLLGAALVAAAFLATTAYGAVDRPALFAGYLYDRGGIRRSIQLLLERHLSPPALAAAALAFGLLLLALATAGFVRHASRATRVVVAGVAGLSIVLWLWTSRAPAPAARPNVLVLVVDSMNVEDADAAPRLAALEREGASFRDAATPCAFTYPSMATLLTGRHPARHGVRTIYPEREARLLPYPNLAVELGEAGWRTTAVSGYCGTIFREMDLGFDHRRTPRGEVDLIVAAAALRGHPWLPLWLSSPAARALLPWMRAAIEGSDPVDVAKEIRAAWRGGPGPFFVTAFFDNPHLPYVPVWPESAGAGEYAGANRYALVAGDFEAQVKEGQNATHARHDVAERDNLRRLHRASVLSVDRAIGEVLDDLEEDGLASSTIVVVLADHGENLLEDGGALAHGESVERDRSARIPWIVRWPGRVPAASIDGPVSMEDVAPTILDLLALPPLEGADGVSRAATLLDGAPVAPRLRLIETGMWFYAREAVERIAPGEGALAYPDFTDGLIEVEPGSPPHIVIAAGEREATVRAKHRRLDDGEYSLTYVPLESGARWRLFRRDLDPHLTRDLSKEEPAELVRMIEEFRKEGARLGDATLPPP